MALTREQKNKCLDENGTMLLASLSPFFMEEDTLAQLVQGNPPILFAAQKRTLQDTQDSQKRCRKFLDDLRAGSLEMYSNFISLLRRNHKTDIADILAGTQNDVAPCQQAGSPEAGTQSSTAASHQAANLGDFKLNEKQVQKFLAKHGAALMTSLKRYMGAALLRDLVAGNALTKQETGLIQNERSPDDQVDKLLEFISDADKFHYFREVLKDREENYVEKLIQSFLAR